jgi:hypothetical protein
VESPLRLKKFFEIQIASAEALKQTNDKINALLDATTMKDIQQIVVNLKSLTNNSSTLVASTNALINTVGTDVHQVSISTTQLSNSLQRLSSNINSLVADPKLKGDIKSLVSELRQTVLQAQALINDPELNQTLRNANTTLTNVNEVALLAKSKLESETITTKMEESLTQLNQLLVKVNSYTGSEDPAISKSQLQGLVKDASLTLTNLRMFSERLKGRFLLWRLAF